MTETNSTGTAELANLRPSEGEYFYAETNSIRPYHGQNSYATCFVCGEKTSNSCSYYHLHAIAQCLAAGRRIAAMFKPEACYGPVLDTSLEPAVSVIISACEAHKHCAEILHCLTADGIITLGHISRAERALVSHCEFNELVAKGAQALWSRNESSRSQHNWCDAWGLFLKETGRIPSLSERAERSRRLWQERKEAQALADWLEAEKTLSALYTVDTP